MPPEGSRTLTVRDDLVSPWPDAAQERLLFATILKDERAVTEWLRWLENNDLDNVEPGSRRLLPETYTNLVGLGFSHPSLEPLKEMKQKAWLENQFLLHQIEDGLRALTEAGIPTLILKGVALVLRHYQHFGRRPMADLDVVVPTERADEAKTALASAGYRLDEEATRGHDKDQLHAATYISDTGRQVDLHWHVVFGCRNDQPFWETAIPVRVGKIDTLAPGPAELLLHVCVHGVRANPVAPTRWIVDSAVIIRDGDVDWDRLVAIARKLRFSYRLSEALHYLERFELEIPQKVVPTLASHDRFGLERLECEQITWMRHKGVATQVASTWLGFQRFTTEESNTKRIATLRRYLQERWKVSRGWALPATIIRKTVSQFGRGSRTDQNST